MKIAICGASGFVGRNLKRYLEKLDYQVETIERRDLESKSLDFIIRYNDCIINLAGSPVNDRWTKQNQERILKSRIDTTRKIVDAINLSKEPKTLINCSAIGIYSNDIICDENHYTIGQGFLAEVCREWERAASACSDVHRLIITRFGLVLGKDGKTMKALKAPLNMHIAPIIGSGKQSMSWIAMDDLVRIMEYLINNSKSRGSYNLTAPFYTSNKEFMSLLAEKKKHTLKVYIPKLFIRLILGQQAALYTEGQKILPTRLSLEGYNFIYPNIKSYTDSL